MQAKGQGKALDFHHNISNCPEMIAKFSKINMTSVPDQVSDEESNESNEYVEFYNDQSL